MESSTELYFYVWPWLVDCEYNLGIVVVIVTFTSTVRTGLREWDGGTANCSGLQLCTNENGVGVLLPQYLVPVYRSGFSGN